MGKYITLVVVGFCIAFTHGGNATNLRDKRLAPITKSDLIRGIFSTPLNSPLHQELLLRASHSGLMDVAYNRYTVLWQQHPNNADANLLRGVAAEYLCSDSMYPEFHKLYLKIPKQGLFPTAATCLANAVKLNPGSPAANREDGFFLWQYGNNLPTGLMLLKKALRLDPNEPRIHTMWGNIYANPSTPDYDLEKARYQLELSAKLDPTYSMTHFLLGSVYSRLDEPEKAKNEEEIYKDLQMVMK